jgi:hypothetical protein
LGDRRGETSTLCCHKFVNKEGREQTVDLDAEQSPGPCKASAAFPGSRYPRLPSQGSTPNAWHKTQRETPSSRSFKVSGESASPIAECGLGSIQDGDRCRKGSGGAHIAGSQQASASVEEVGPANSGTPRLHGAPATRFQGPRGKVGPSNFSPQPQTRCGRRQMLSLPASAS